MPTHIHKFKKHLRDSFRQRKDADGTRKKVSEGYVYITMIRLKAYIKRLSERGYLDQLRPSDIPINKVILQNPTYLNKGEMKQILNYLELRVQEVEMTKSKRDHKYPAYM